MQPSPLDLLHYYLIDLTITPETVKASEINRGANNYPSFDDVEFWSQVEHRVRRNDPDPHTFMIMLKLKGEPKENSSFPYRFSIGAEALIQISPNYPAETRESLIVTNGAAMLYGALREQILNLTSRFRYGPILLPTVNFLNLIQKENVEEKQKISTVKKPRKSLKDEPKVKAIKRAKVKI